LNFLRLSIIFLCFSITSLSAQTGPAGQSTPKEPCSHKQQALTLQPANKGQTTPTSKKVCDMTRTIPVVVHVVHMCGPENVSDLQIQNAITALDLTFNKLNNYGASIPTTDPHYNNIADIGINFKLAEIDPNGNATTGITRTESHLTYAGGVLEGQLKQLINWDRSKYLNIWVVASSGGSAYAQYPATVDQPPYIEYDGIVSTHTYFGATGTASGNPYPEILTHEVGHWLNLIHTWGDQYFVNDPQACNDDDMVADTPNTVGNYTVGCTNLNPDSCADPGVDNEHNFMDYACEVMFTNGQKARMWDCLCSPIAQRDTIGTAGSNVFTFLPNPTTPRFTTSGYFFKESPLNNGTIQSSIDITLSSGSFVPTLINGTHYTFSPALPSGLSLSVTNTGGNVVTLSITGNAANHSNSNDVSNLTINFNSSAVLRANEEFGKSSMANIVINLTTDDVMDTKEENRSH